LQFPPSIEIGKVFALRKGWKYSDYKPEERLVGPAVRTLIVNGDTPLKLKLGYQLTEHPELLSQVAPDAFVKIDSNKIEFKDSICQPLSKLVSIVQLELDDSEITDKGVEQLAALPKIRYLNIDRTNIKGSCLHALRATKSLRSLAVNDNAISPGCYKYFAELPPLTHLSVRNCSLTDEVLKYIGQIKTLEDLTLTANSKLTDEGLKNLRGLKHLRSMDVADAKLTAQGVEQLKGLPLKQLTLPKPLLDASAKRLQAAFPHTHIYSGVAGRVTADDKMLFAPFRY